MAGETTLTVVGNLTADPELRYTNNGLAVANFTIASTPKVFDRQRNELVDGDALFLRASVWREHAEQVAQSLVKGSRVIVQGRLRQRSFQDRDGQQRTSIELEIDEIGPSLRFATAQVTRTTGGAGGSRGRQAGAQYGQQIDHSATSTAYEGEQRPSGGQQSGGQAMDVWSQPGQYDDETPF